MIIPDSLHGAIMLSLIDFFLSMVVISFIGVVLALFPLLNKVAHLDDETIRKTTH
jgi:hypothetical protein